MSDKKSAEKKNSVIADERHNTKGAKKLGLGHEEDKLKINKDGGNKE